MFKLGGSMTLSAHSSVRPVGNAGWINRHMKHNTGGDTSVDLPSGGP